MVAALAAVDRRVRGRARARRRGAGHPRRGRAPAFSGLRAGYIHRCRRGPMWGSGASIVRVSRAAHGSRMHAAPPSCAKRRRSAGSTICGWATALRASWCPVTRQAYAYPSSAVRTARPPSPYAENEPSVTTVTFHPEWIARSAVPTLVKLIESGHAESPGRLTAPTGLGVRTSSRPPRMY
ncbi:hypothetical protein [Streptomyces sp. NPDC054961]